MFNMNFSSHDPEILGNGVGAGYSVVYQYDFFNVPPYIKILLSVICMHSYE